MTRAKYLFIKKSLSESFCRIDKEKQAIEISLIEFDEFYSYLIEPTHVKDFQDSINILNKPFDFKQKSELIFSLKLKQVEPIVEKRLDFIDLTRSFLSVSKNSFFKDKLFNFLNVHSQKNQVLFIACVDSFKDNQETIQFVSRFTQNKESNFWDHEQTRTHVHEDLSSDEYMNIQIDDFDKNLYKLTWFDCQNISIDQDNEVPAQKIESLSSSLCNEWAFDEPIDCSFESVESRERVSVKRKCDSLECNF